jgi:ribose transport system permease protein
VLFASAQMVVILTRGFDLSLGASVSAISVASALVMTGLDAGNAASWIVVAAGLATGLGFGFLVGLFNGGFISWLGINPFVVTLGSLNICLGRGGLRAAVFPSRSHRVRQSPLFDRQ